MNQPSPQQQAVIDWVRDGHGSAFVEAVAGAGKTTTLINALAETQGSVAFAAYNTKIAKEIQAKAAPLNLGNRVRIATFHSFGLNAWRRVNPGVKCGPEAANEKRDMTIAKFRSVNSPERLDNFTLKLASLAKQRALGLFGSVDDMSKWHDIVDHFDLADELELDDPSFSDKAEVTIDNGIKLAIRTLNYHRAIGDWIVDFDDMIWLPVTSNIRMWQNDWVFVDEAQDTNPARRAMARKMLRPNGRAVFVGDRHQAIYGFTGADSEAINLIQKEFSCEVLPLTVTFRCPKAVVAEARYIVNHIQAHETAPEGKVSNVDYKEFLTPASLKSLTAADAILCRKTKPLVSLAFHLIKNGVACHVEGRDIGAGLIKLVLRFNSGSLALLRERLVDHAEKECAKLLAKGRETQAESLSDRVETLTAMIDAQPSGTVRNLTDRIRDMFTDADDMDKLTLTLSTVHKSKGREWPRVFILGRSEYMPGPWARQEWQQVQEANVIYVAITRSQGELVNIFEVEA